MDTSKDIVMYLVEDDPGDQKLIKSALAAQEEHIDLYIADSAEEALKHLEYTYDGKSQHPLPSLILLDLNMPGMGGKELLKWLKANEKFKNIPVVVLTTSDSEADINECYKLHAAGYIQKPGNVQELKMIMKQTIKYWSSNLFFIKS